MTIKKTAFIRGIAIGAFILIAGIMLSGCTIPEQEVYYPSARGYVVDEADVLSPEAEASLSSQLADFKDTAEIAVVTIKTTQPLDEKQYAINLANQWGVGDEATDTGILFLVVTEDRKLRIEVGSGAEGYMTDAEAGRILDKYVVPELKNNNWESGIKNGVNAIMKEAK